MRQRFCDSKRISMKNLILGKEFASYRKYQTKFTIQAKSLRVPEKYLIKFSIEAKCLWGSENIKLNSQSRVSVSDFQQISNKIFNRSKGCASSRKNILKILNRVEKISKKFSNDRKCLRISENI